MTVLPLFLFYLFRFFGENIDKYNRKALFAGRRTIRIIKIITVFTLRVVGPITFQKKKKKTHRILNASFHKNTK